MRFVLACSSAALLFVAVLTGAPESDARWWRGNTHTHTLWSDGDAAPTQVVGWYARSDYDFLVLSDHNQLQVGERWLEVSEGGRLTPDHVELLAGKFGEDAVRLRGGEQGASQQMKLATLDELRDRFERQGDFILVPGEEITSHLTQENGPNLPVHINGVNLQEYVAPRGGETVVDIMNKTMAAVVEQSEASGKPMFAHLNHPNFGWGLGWEDVAQMEHERFFEVYNGHRSVRNEGNESRPSTERMWDLANQRRLTELGLPLLYGVATDDAHNYHGNSVSQPGRGWVMVRSDELSPDAITAAMRRGDFYSSSGVILRDVRTENSTYHVHIDEEEGVSYTTRFIGSKLALGELGDASEVLLETDENPARFSIGEDILFVRAVVTSSRVHPNPYRTGDMEQAWTQPVRP